MKTIVMFFLTLVTSTTVFGQTIKNKKLAKYFPAATIAHPNDAYGNPTFYFRTEGESVTTRMYEYNSAAQIVKKVTIILYRDSKKRNRYHLHYIEIAHTDYDGEGNVFKNRVYRIINKADLKDYVKQAIELAEK